jgi:hypothetical protein
MGGGSARADTNEPDRVVKSLSARRPNSLYASLLLAVSVLGIVLAPFTAGNPARRVRAGGTRGAGVIHQVRVEPYGRAAAEHAYFDDDEDEAHLEAASDQTVDAPSHDHAPFSFIFSAAGIAIPDASALRRQLAGPSRAGQAPLGVPSGRAPPRL